MFSETPQYLSGYPVGFRLQTIIGGLLGHLKLSDRSARGLTKLHRSKSVTLESKESKESVPWYKRSDINYRGRVLFVPATPGSQLANSIKELERANRQGRNSRVKVVERSGTTVRNTLVKSYPWSIYDCEDPLCFPCSSRSTTGRGHRTVSCRRPGVGYQITCLLCKDEGVVAVYQGESGRNLYTRGKEHLDGLSFEASSNPLTIHNKTHHGGSRNNHFSMVATRTFQKPLDRQIDESICLKFSTPSSIIMNSGSEWRGDAIPRAAFSSPGLESRRKEK